MRKTVGITDMHNACILWHIGTDYPFIKIKEKGELVGSLTPNNGNVLFQKKEMVYVYKRKTYMYQNLLC